MIPTLEEQLSNVMLAILDNIVQYPDHLTIEAETGDNTINFTIKAHKDDRGKVIGKKGSMIHSLRIIVRAIASRDHMRTVVNIID